MEYSTIRRVSIIPAVIQRVIAFAAIAVMLIIVAYSAFSPHELPIYLWFLPLVISGIRFFIADFTVKIGDREFHISKNKLEEGDVEKIKKALSE